MRKNASVTVFLALTLTIMTSLILALTESARTAGAQFYVQTMADSAMASLFSEYHRELWDSYRLILRSDPGTGENEEALLKYAAPYIRNSGWYAVSDPSAAFRETSYVTDRGGIWFEQEVKDYMTYAWADMDASPAAASELLKQVREAGTMQEILKDLGLQSREAMQMEKAVGKVSANLAEQKRLKQEARSDLRDGDTGSFFRTADRLSDTIGLLPGLISDYDRKAEAFGIQLNKTEEKHREKLDTLSEANRKAVLQRFDDCRAYTDEDGARRVEIDALDDGNAAELAYIEDMKELAEEIEEMIEEAEEEDDEEDEDGDDIDEDELWREAAEAWDDLEIPSYGGPQGVGDPEKAGLLEAFSSLSGDILVSLVVPDSIRLSDETLDRSAFPSAAAASERGESDLLTAAIVGEYAGRFLRTALDGNGKQYTCELEYAVTGKDTDSASLKTALLEILAVREGLNFIGILSDSRKLEKVTDLAMKIGGEGMIPALSLLLECLIIACWALAESLMDLRAMLEGKKVAILKSENSWMTGLGDILSIAAFRKLPEKKLKDAKYGVGYTAWLKLLLFMKKPEERNYRIMDIIQLNICRTDPSFRMDRCIYGMRAEVTVSSGRIFTGLLPSEYAGRVPGSCSVTASTARAY